MARVVGLDIGALTVKAVVLEVGLRTWELVEAVEEAILFPAPEPVVPPEAEAASAGESGAHETPPADADEAAPESAPSPDEVLPTLGAPTLEAIARLHARGIFEGDAVYTGLAPDSALLTRLTLPFSADKEIAPVLAPQLEGRLPADVDDLLLDFMRGGQLESREYVVYVAGIEPATMALLLAELNDVGVDPKVVDVAPFPLLTAARALLPEAPTGPIAVVDIGADATGVAIFDALDLQYARTFSGGGERITNALADMFSLDAPTARAGKHREGFIDDQTPENEGPTGQDAIDISNACRTAVKPLIRQLRRTLHAHASEWNTGIERVYLCGGSVALPGLAQYIGQSLGVETMLLPTAVPSTSSVPEFATEGPRFATALGLALRGVSGIKGSSMNARVGPFTFKGTYEYVRQRVPQMIAGAAILAVLSLAFVFGRIAVANAELRALDDALTEATMSVFGTEMTSPNDIASRFRLGGTRPAFIPDVSAYGLFVTASNTIGETLDLGYTVAATDIEIDLERRIFRMQGTADSAESVDTFETQLATHTCFREIERNDLSQVARGEGFEFSVQGIIQCTDAPAPEDS